MFHPHNERGRGFTLIEALMASAVLAMAITAITMPFAAGAKNEQVDARQTLAVGLAQEMMEEILSKPFDDPNETSTPGPEATETSRRRFYNVDDYNGYSEASGAIEDINGIVITDGAAAGLSRDVSAEYFYVTGQDMGKKSTFVRVTTAVRHNGNPLVTVTRLVYDLPGS